MCSTPRFRLGHLRRCLLATLALVLPATGVAQTGQTGLLEGTVTVPNGRVVANVVVAIRQEDGSYPREVRADRFGHFRINFVSPGRYRVEARLIGYRPLVFEAVEIRATQSTTLDIVLTPSRTVLEPLATTVAPTRINTTNTEFTSSLLARERERLPAPRDANALVRFTPAARPGQLFGGSTDQANLYQLDGVTVNQPGTGGSFLLPNVDWIEDFRVIGVGAGAEYGNFQGGLVNIVTKSGSNTVRGQLRTFYESRALNARNINAFEAGAELDNRVELNAELGGPLVRDRVYFYLSGQESRSRTRVLDLQGATPSALAWLPTLGERREQKYYGKLTWQADDDNILNVSAGFDNLRRERVGLTGFDDIDATVQGRSPSVFYQANWQRSFSNRSFLEVKLSGFRGRDDELPYNGSDVPAVGLLDAPNAPRFVNAFYTQRNSPASNGLTAVFSRYFNTLSWEHHIKVGGEYTTGLWREERTRNGGLSWFTEAGAGFDPRNPATWQEIPSLGVYATADTGGRIDLNADTRNMAVYVQDYIQASDRIALSAGLRVGRWVGNITPGRRGLRTNDAEFQAVQAAGFDPRLGVTFDMRGDASLVTKAHWGRYHQNMFALFFDRAPGANVFTNIDFCDWNNRDGSVRPEFGAQYTAAQFRQLFTCVPGVNLFNEANRIVGYRQPYMDQWTLGVEKTLGANLTAEVLYINRRNRNVIALQDNDLAQNWSPISNVAVSDARGPVRGPDGQPVVFPTLFVRNDDLAERLFAGDVVPGYNLAQAEGLRYRPDIVLRAVDEARRQFNQLRLSLAGSYPRVMFNVALSYTRLTGNLFSVHGYLNPNGDGDGPFVNPNQQLNFGGNLQNYAPLDLTARVSGTLPWDFEGGAFLNVTSGDFWTPTLELSRQLDLTATLAGGTPVALDDRLFAGSVGQALFAEPRGNRQLRAQTTLDLRLQRIVALGRNAVIVGFEVFNLFNGSAVTGRNLQLTNQDATNPASLAGAVRLRQIPTTLRLNVQYRL